MLRFVFFVQNEASKLPELPEQEQRGNHASTSDFKFDFLTRFKNKT